MQEEDLTPDADEKPGLGRRTMMKVLGGTALAGAGLSGTASASSHTDPFVFRGWKVTSDTYDYFGVVYWMAERDDDGDVTNTSFGNTASGGNGQAWLPPNAVAAYAVANDTVYPNRQFAWQAKFKLLDTPSISQTSDSELIYLNNVDSCNIGSLSITYAGGNYGRDAGCVVLSREELLGETDRYGAFYQDDNDRTGLHVDRLADRDNAVPTHATFVYGPCYLKHEYWTNDHVEFPAED